MTARVSLGIAAAVGADLASRIAPLAEAAGFHALWVNDTPGSDALEVLAAAARETKGLVLATGVLPVDRRAPRDILDRIADLGLPADRLVLGIGSGAGASGALARVRTAAEALGQGSAAQVVVGALGPRMRELGATESDGLLLSWLTPEVASEQAAEAHRVAPGTHVALYVRTAVEAAAHARLEAEAARYAGFPAYAANFERLGIDPRATVLRADAVAEGLAAYRGGVDEVVLRAIVADESLAGYARFVQVAAGAATWTRGVSVPRSVSRGRPTPAGGRCSGTGRRR